MRFFVRENLGLRAKKGVGRTEVDRTRTNRTGLTLVVLGSLAALSAEPTTLTG